MVACMDGWKKVDELLRGGNTVQVDEKWME